MSAGDTPLTDRTLRTLAQSMSGGLLAYVGCMTTIVGPLLWIASAVAYFTAEAVAAVAVPGYSYIVDYISSLGVPGTSPHATVMNAAFLLQGVCFPAGAVLLVCGTRARKALPFLVFAVLNGVGNVLVGVVHGGTGSRWHLAGAVLAIVGGNLAVLAGAWLFRHAGTSAVYVAASAVLGGMGIFCATALAVEATPIGLWERGSVYPIFVWQTLTAGYLVRRRTEIA